MAIVSSVKFQDAHEQRDGSRYVGELHTDNIGLTYRFEYRASQAMMANRDAVMAARAVKLDEQIQIREAKEALRVDSAPTLNYQTGAQFLDRVRALYRESDKELCTRIATWLMNRLDAGDVTQAQLRNAWNLTVQQWNNVETRMRNHRTSITAVDAAEGE